MSALELFRYETHQLRTQVLDGQPWFVAADVCAVLGIGRTQDAVRYLDDDERRGCLVDTPGGEQQVSMINEPGLYSLILRSRKPEARRFKRWITHEVLPAIRRTGSYSSVPQPTDLVAMARQLVAEADRADSAEQRAAELEQRMAQVRTALGVRDRVPTPRPAIVDPRREVVRRWVEACTAPSSVGTQASHLYRAFAATPAGRGITNALFGRALSELGYPARSGGLRGNVKSRPLRVVRDVTASGVAPILRA